MIVRINGGNSGIGDYLVNGNKQGRDYSRDELDNRLILDGDLALTESVIDSIEDKGQERYLHISLSFAEDDISFEKLSAITDEYKKTLLSAYDEQEVNFYAEAHLPKIKNYIDPRTGGLVERKPHIHIVIPRINLVTQRSLNPVGLVDSNIEYLDAIQEKINSAHGLVSPKDRRRNLSDGRTESMSLIIVDFKGESKKEFKSSLVDYINENAIDNYEDFKSYLTSKHDVRIYNSGKDSEYLGVKLEGDSKYTRLKNSIFTKDNFGNKQNNNVLYSENKDIIEHNNSLVNEWVDYKANEVKFMPLLSQKRRDEYYALSDIDKIHYLDDLKEKFNEKHGIKRVSSNRARSANESFSRPIRDGNTKRGIKNNSKRTASSFRQEERLPPVRQRNMVYGIHGRNSNSARQSRNLLQNDSVDNLAEIRENRLNRNGGMRWIQEDRGGRGRLTSELASQNLVLSDETKEVLDHIKKHIDSERFVSYCVKNFNINPKEMKISKGRDGSPRFGYMFANYNAIDYLTKGANVKLDDAINMLYEVYQEQLRSEPFHRIKMYKRKFSLDEMEVKNASYKEKSSILFEYKKTGQRLAREKYRDDLRAVFKDRALTENEKSVLKGYFLFEYMQEKSRVEKLHKEILMTVRNDHFNFDIEKLDAYNKRFEKMVEKFEFDLENTNAIVAYDSRERRNFQELLRKNMHYAKHEMRIAENRDLNEFFVVKGTSLLGKLTNRNAPTNLSFSDKETKEEIFKDVGNRLNYEKKDIDKSNIAVMAEYAVQKYGKELKLTGNAEFKTAAAIAFAEKGLDVQLKPAKYMEIYEKHKELTASKELLSSDRVNDNESMLEVFNRNKIDSNVNAQNVKIAIMDLDLSAYKEGVDTKPQNLSVLEDIAEEYNYSLAKNSAGNYELNADESAAKIDLARAVDELERKGFTYTLNDVENVLQPSIDTLAEMNPVENIQEVRDLAVESEPVSTKEPLERMAEDMIKAVEPTDFDSDFMSDYDSYTQSFNEGIPQNFTPDDMLTEMSGAALAAIQLEKEMREVKENKEKELEKERERKQLEQQRNIQKNTLSGLAKNTAYGVLSAFGIQHINELNSKDINADLSNISNAEKQALLDSFKERGQEVEVFGGRELVLNRGKSTEEDMIQTLKDLKDAKAEIEIGASMDMDS